MNPQDGKNLPLTSVWGVLTAGWLLQWLHTAQWNISYVSQWEIFTVLMCSPVVQKLFFKKFHEKSFEVQLNWVPGGAVGAARLGVAVAQRRRPLLAVLALEEPVGIDFGECRTST